MRAVLELLRILVLLVIFGAVAAVLTESIYTVNESVAAYAWISGIALLLLFFVAYRNALQFSGWYKGEQRKKLPKKVTAILISISIVLLLVPFVLGTLF
ncbi:MAG TPA: hypothetical protein VK067_05680 [Pseudogracilibacillus sp.]|nr:hypothetical protein [Pseudogracilibacillus sp.]